MNQEKLNEVLKRHQIWLTQDNEGERADLRAADLRGANLRDANLCGSDLSNANLTGAKGIIQWQAPLGIKRICYSVKHDVCVMHKLGCFWGTTDDAVKAIRVKYGNESMYEKLLVLNAQALEIEE